VSARAGVIGWISQGIGKVMPQPDEKYIKDETPEPDEVTEVRNGAILYFYQNSTNNQKRLKKI